MKTNWSKLSSLAEIISSIAIVITLIYLSAQTKQNTAATLASTRNQIIESDLVVIQSLIDNPEISSYMHQDELTENEKNQLQAWLISLARTREHQWLQYQNNLLDQQTWDAYVSGMTANFSYPRTRDWWDSSSYDFFDDDFVNEVNLYLDKIPIFADYSHRIKQ